MEQIGEAKVLWKKREFTTLLTVDEDERDPNELRTAFTLIRSVSDHSSPRVFCTLFLPHMISEGSIVLPLCLAQ